MMKVVVVMMIILEVTVLLLLQCHEDPRKCRFVGSY